MTLLTELHVAHPDLVLSPTIDAVPAMTIYRDGRLAADPRSAPLFYTVTGTEPAAFETALETDHTVTDRMCVAANDERHTYRLRLTPEVTVVSGRAAELGIRTVQATSENGGWRLRIQAPDHDALGAFRTHCRDRGVGFRIDQLCQSEAPRGRRPMLSDDQRTALVTAYEEGYFDVPRQASQTDLADALDVSGSAMSQRLRRAMAHLVSSTLRTDVD